MYNIEGKTKKEIEGISARYEAETKEIEKERQLILDRLRVKVAQKKLKQIFEKKDE